MNTDEDVPVESAMQEDERRRAEAIGKASEALECIERLSTNSMICIICPLATTFGAWRIFISMAGAMFMSRTLKAECRTRGHAAHTCLPSQCLDAS
jgi:hypothetical protein